MSAPSFRRSFEIRTLPADGDLVAVEFPLFRKYQICHHRENPEEVQLLPWSWKPPFHYLTPTCLKVCTKLHIKSTSCHQVVSLRAYEWAWTMAADSTAAVQVTEATFRRFLIDTPLTPSFSPGGVRFGSYHQQYWVDGQRPHGHASVHSLTISSPLKALLYCFMSVLCTVGSTLCQAAEGAPQGRVPAVQKHMTLWHGARAC